MKKLISLGIVSMFAVMAFAAQAKNSDAPGLNRTPKPSHTVSVPPSPRPSASVTPKNLRAACQVAAKDAYNKAKKDADKIYNAAKKANKGRDGKDARNTAKVSHNAAVKAAKNAFKVAKDACKEIKPTPKPSPTPAVTPAVTPTPTQ